MPEIRPPIAFLDSKEFGCSAPWALRCSTLWPICSCYIYMEHFEDQIKSAGGTWMTPSHNLLCMCDEKGYCREIPGPSERSAPHYPVHFQAGERRLPAFSACPPHSITTSQWIGYHGVLEAHTHVHQPRYFHGLPLDHAHVHVKRGLVRCLHDRVKSVTTSQSCLQAEQHHLSRAPHASRMGAILHSCGRLPIPLHHADPAILKTMPATNQ